MGMRLGRRWAGRQDMHVSAGCSWRSGGGRWRRRGTRTGREGAVAVGVSSLLSAAKRASGSAWILYRYR